MLMPLILIYTNLYGQSICARTPVVEILTMADDEHFPPLENYLTVGRERLYEHAKERVARQANPSPGLKRDKTRREGLG